MDNKIQLEMKYSLNKNSQSGEYHIRGYKNREEKKIYQISRINQ